MTRGFAAGRPDGRSIHLLLLVILLGAPAVWAAIRQVHESESQNLLRATATAHRRVSYAGAVVWNIPFKQTTFGVRHDAKSGRTTYSADGPWKQWTMPTPSSRLPDPAAWCLAPDRLVENYTAEETGSDEFLGRPVRVLRVRPRHRGRPSLEIWADTESLLPLKVTTYRPDGSVYRVAKFRRVEFGPQPQANRDVTDSHQWLGERVPLDGLAYAARFAPLLPEYLPEGFKLVEARVKQWATPRLTLLYSDGATAFELSQAPLATPAVLEDFHARHMGREKARGMVDWHVMMARQRLIDTDGAPEGEDRITCRYRRGSIHSTHELRVDGLEVKLSARSDLDRELVLRVLRSLRRP